MSGEEVRFPIEDGVEASVAGQPSEQTLDHHLKSNGKKLAVAGSAGRDRDMNVMVESGLGEGHALVATVTQQIALKTQFCQPGQHRCGAGPIVGVGRCQLKIEPRAMLVADGIQLDAFDQLAAIDAAHPAGRRRAQRAAVHDDGGRQSLVAAGNAPVERQALSEPPPQPQPGPTSKRAVQRGERDTGQGAEAMRHCMPPKVSIQISPSTRRRSSGSGLRPRR